MTRSTDGPGHTMARTGLAAVLAVLAALLGAAVAAPMAASAAAPAPQMSVTLDDGAAQVRSNSDVTYTATVANRGGTAVAAELVLTTPAYVVVTHADGAKAAAHSATWALNVPAGASVTRTAKAHIGQIAKGEFRVTTLASVYQGKATTGVPLIRTAVANTIAGVKDPARTVPMPTAAAKSGGGGTDWLLVAGLPVLAVVVLAVGLVTWARRRPGGLPVRTAVLVRQARRKRAHAAKSGE